jgi:transposase
VVFEDYVERVLAPILLLGQVMILDNRGAHNAGRTREVERAIWWRCAAASSCSFRPTTPDRNPIEEAFSRR